MKKKHRFMKLNNLCRAAAALFVLTAFCGVPARDAILNALGKSDLQTAVEKARNDSRSARFLAIEVLKSGADDKATKPALAGIIRGAGREIMPVIESLKDGKCKRLKVESLAKLHAFGKGSALDKLEEYLDSDKGLVRAAAVGAFLSMDQGEGFCKKFLLDPEPEIRLATARYLASTGFPWARDLLFDAAGKDPDPRVRETAIRGLDPKEGRDMELLKSIVEGQDTNLILAALKALAGRPETLKLPWMQEFLTPPVSVEGIHYAAELMKNKEMTPQISEYLAAALSSSSPTIRQKLIGALTLHKVALEGACELAGDKNPEVLLAWAVYARKMSTLEDKRIEVLEKLAARKDDIALRALVALSEEKSVSYDKIRKKIWGLIKKGEKKDRIYILSFTGRSIVDPPLAVEAMADDDPVVRLHAAAAYLRH
ncbi:MAG: HEAT repeat domain-containing protein [Pseudomonadota bacterium]